MGRLSDAVRRVLKRARKTEPVAADDAIETDELLDGDHAAALLEACVVEAAGVGSGSGASNSGARFSQQWSGENANALGRAVGALVFDDGRSAVASSTGLAMTGVRASAFVSSAELCAAQSELLAAVGNHVPLVLNLSCQAAPGPGQLLGGAHHGYHLAASSGSLLFFATNVQDLIDLALIARRTAERALVPAVVAFDGEQIGRSLQNVRFPSAQLIRQYLGAPNELIESPTPAQRMIFGEQRPRVVAWHDLDRPSLSGAMQPPQLSALAAVSHRAYISDHLPELLDDSARALTALTGRTCDPLTAYRTEDAKLLIVAQGGAVETAQAAAEELRDKFRTKVGVIGIRCLRPLAGATLAALMQRCKQIVVLERGDNPLGELPLTAEIRACVQRAAENGSAGQQVHSGYPLFSAKEIPAIHTAVYGAGGSTLKARQVVGLCCALPQDRRVVYFDARIGGKKSSYPQREVTLAQLNREYPQAGQYGIQAADSLTAPDDVVAVRVYRRSGTGGKLLAYAIGRSMQRALGGTLRARRGVPQAAWDQPVYSDVLLAPGDQPFAVEDLDNVDVTVIVHATKEPRRRAMDRIGQSRAVLFEVHGEDDAPWKAMRQGATPPVAAVYSIQINGDEPNAAREARLCGAALGVLIQRNRLTLSESQIRSLAKQEFEDVPEAEQGALIAAFVDGTQAVKHRGQWADLAPKQHAPHASDAPLALQALARSSAESPASGTVGFPVDSLRRFWHDVGAAYDAGDTHELSADPLIAMNAIPPLSARLHRIEPGTNLPSFQADKCEGCGLCWVLCPDGAISAKAVSAKGLVAAAMARVNDAGGDVKALRSIQGKLAGTMQKLLADAGATGSDATGSAPSNARALFEAALEPTLKQFKLNAEKTKAIKAAFATAVDALDTLPIAKTKTFFDDAELAEKGAGKLLAVTVNVDACKGCGICTNECPAQAMPATVRDGAHMAAAQQLWSTAEYLPDADAETIARVREHKDVGLLPAIMLDERNGQALAGDGSEPGSGAKIALRAALGVAENTLRPRVATLQQQVEELQTALSEKVQQVLAAALPADDLTALSAGIAGLQGEAGQPSLNDLLQRVESVVQGKRVDVVRLQRLVDAGHELADAHWRLTQGIHGLGRSRLSLVIRAEANNRGLAVFPRNPFHVPVLLDAGARTAALTTGVLEGQTRHAVDLFRSIRRAKLALSNPKEAAMRDAMLERLDYASLESAERELCSPVVVVAKTLDTNELARMLDTELPAKVLLLTDGGGSWLGASTELTEPEMLALGERGAYMAQTSIGDVDHLSRVLTEAFAYTGPAIVRVHAPSPRDNGFAPESTVAQARLAVRCRVNPLLSLDPPVEGGFVERLNLEGNPAADEAWCANDGGAQGNGEAQADGEARGPCTLADWAATQERFACHFEPLNVATAWESVDAYLALPSEKRKKAVAGVVPCGSDTPQHVSEAVTAMAEYKMKVWRLLQEVAGPNRSEIEAAHAEKAALIAEHKQAIADLAAKHAKEIDTLRNESGVEIANEVHGRLMTLAGYEGRDA